MGTSFSEETTSASKKSPNNHQPAPVSHKQPSNPYNQMPYQINFLSANDFVNDVMITDEMKEIVKLMVKEYCILWHDPNVDSKENAKYLNQLRDFSEVQTSNDWKAASGFIRNNSSLCFHVISSGKDGEKLTKEISSLENVHSISLFCRKIDFHTKWAEKYKPKLVCIENSFSTLFSKLEATILQWQRTASSLRVNLPAFAPIFNDADTSDIRHLHFSLHGLKDFRNRRQAKQDFLTLARAIRTEQGNIIEFENHYSAYDTRIIINWYTRETFFYKILNNCLRIATASSILYCRLALNDMERAIKEIYEEKSKNFHGLLFRGTYISSQEWDQLQQNVGKEIEMYGFLSTSKVRNVAVNFAAQDIKNKALLTIIVPAVSEKGQQGFAEIKEYSTFSNEEEVLFNIMSRFTVVAATKELIGPSSELRHLVLAYGLRELKLEIKTQEPLIELEISQDMMKCAFCDSGFNERNSLAFINLSDHKNYSCLDCLQHQASLDRSPYLGINDIQEDHLNIKIVGRVIKYSSPLNLKFYGTKCHQCQKTDLPSPCYSCYDCSQTWCNDCFSSENQCVQNSHKIIFQQDPFTFWGTPMSNQEYDYLMHQNSELTEFGHHAQFHAFSKTHNYDKAQKYYENYLGEVDPDSDEKVYILNNLGANNLNQGNFPEAINNFKEAIQILNSRTRLDKEKMLSALYNNLGYSYSCIQQYENAITHHTTALEIEKTVSQGSEGMASILNNIGIAYSHLKQFQKSIQAYTEALEIQIKCSGEKNPNAAKTYDNIGTAYLRSGQPKRAIEYHSKGLEIFKTIFGEKHPDTAQAYTLIGSDYEKLGDINKALEFKLKALEITKALFGYAHSDTKEAYKNLGGLCLQTGQFEKAIEFYSKSLEIEKLTGEEDYKTLKDLHFGLGCSYAMMKQNKISNEHFLKGLEIHEAHFNEDTPETITTRQNIARNYLQLKEYEKCIEAYKKVLPIRERETDYRTLSIMYFNMGTCYRELGAYKEAINYHIKDLNLMESKLYNLPDIVDCCFIIAELYLDIKALDKSLEFFSKLIEMVTLEFGEKSPQVAENYKKIGTLCHNMGHPQKAAEFFLKFIEIQEPILGKNHKDIVFLTSLIHKAKGQDPKN